jgi:hypothetical protein
MDRFGSFLLGAVIGGAAVFGTLKYHVVYADDGVHFVPKVFANFDDIYVDIRSFDFSDWNEHKSLAAALIKADKGYLLDEAAVNQFQESVGNLLNGFSSDAP